jgi:hypothetical protein
MRVEAGCRRAKADRNGTPYFVHQLTGPPPAATAAPPSGTGRQRADADTLHAVYGAPLELLRWLLKLACRKAAIDAAADRGPVGGGAA